MSSCRVIGIGNPLRGDDGIGCRVIEELEALKPFQNIEFVDLGCGGYHLLSYLKNVDRVILVDAIDAGLSPGTIVKMSAEDLLEGSFVENPGHSHEGNLAQVLLLARTLDKLPEVTVFGVQYKSCELGMGLSPELERAIPELVKMICKHLAGH